MFSIEQMEATGETTNMLAATLHLQGVSLGGTAICLIILYVSFQIDVAIGDPLLSRENYMELIYVFAIRVFILIRFVWTTFYPFHCPRSGPIGAEL